MRMQLSLRVALVVIALVCAVLALVRWRYTRETVLRINADSPDVVLYIDGVELGVPPVFVSREQANALFGWGDESRPEHLVKFSHAGAVILPSKDDKRLGKLLYAKARSPAAKNPSFGTISSPFGEILQVRATQSERARNERTGRLGGFNGNCYFSFVYKDTAEQRCFINRALMRNDLETDVAVATPKAHVATWPKRVRLTLWAQDLETGEIITTSRELSSGEITTHGDDFFLMEISMKGIHTNVPTLVSGAIYNDRGGAILKAWEGKIQPIIVTLGDGEEYNHELILDSHSPSTPK